MNITCSRRHSSWDIDQFIGKDVWVKVHIDTYSTRCVGYIRIISAETKGQDTYYEVNLAKTYGEDTYEVKNSRVIDAKLKYTVTLYEGDVYVVSPLEIRTTDELFVVTG